MEAYLDNSATTKVFPEVVELMSKIMLEDYGNTSSMHLKGVESEQYVKEAKEIIAKILKVNGKEIFFTSGGTESDNLAIIGTSIANYRAGKHIITTKIEHSAVLKTMQHLEQQGFSITYLPVDKYGVVRVEDVKKALRKDTILVSIMHVNNEIGSVQPIEEIGVYLKRVNPHIVFHVDGVQSFGKKAIYPKKMKVDLVSVSGHKIHGPKGVGFLYVDEKVKIRPIIFGGGQQKGLRSGTENVPGVAGMALAAEMIYAKMKKEVEELYHIRECFIQGLAKIDGVVVNGKSGMESAPHIVSASFKGIKSEVLLHALEEKGIYVSAGSACAAQNKNASATLQAIGIEKNMLESTLRFSFSIFTTIEEIDYTLQVMYDMMPMLRKYTKK